MATMTSIMCGPGSDALSNGYSADSVPAQQQQQQLNCVASAATANGDTAHPNVFVRGLPLAWGESELASVFAAYGELSSIRLVRHSMTKHSLGYGFVRFSHVQDAQAAISSLDGTTVLGHKLQVKFADADAGPPAAASPSGLTPSDSCYAKHLPASWGAREVQQLFEAHGAVLDVKLFPCLDQFRGASALVRMASVEAAERAINALNNTTPANGVQSLIVRFAESAAEKAARLQRRERQQQQQQQQQASRAAAAGLPRSALSSGNLGPLNSQHSLLATSPALLSPEQQLQQALSALSLGAADSTLSLPQLVGMGSGGLAAPPTPQLVRPPPAAAVPLAPPIQVNYQPPVLSTVALRGLPQNADRLWVYEHFARFGPIASMRLVFDETTGLCTGSGIINYADHGAGDRARQVLSGMRAGDKVLQVLVQQAGQGSAGPGVLTPQASGQGPSLAQRQASQAAVAAMAAAGLQGMPSSTMPMGYGGDGTPASPLALAFPTSTADWGQSPFNMSGM